MLIKAFCIDFNWDITGPAKPGLFTHADPAEHVRWYKDLGANTIQTFCVSYNGYAWYLSDVAPRTPKLRRNFLGEITELGHKEGMRVLGYFCLGSNPCWEQQNSELVHAEVNETTYKIPFTNLYLDYFCRSVQDVLRKTEIDGFMIDWFRPIRRGRWLDCERDMFRELMGESFPANGQIDDATRIEFERRILERAWVRIKEAVRSVRPAIIWTNHPFEEANDPVWNGHRLLREVDWVLNEKPETQLLTWLEAQIGPRTRIIQNLCGWKNHDASAWKTINTSKHGLYGFAQADPDTTLPSATYTPACAANMRNIAIIREAYRKLRP
ncbi:MAG: hypothetical protein HY360_27290 [Verrucomicrobia bacterium]|nr:hypothetical protein [Verrucomicrobiota bacterium]